MVWGTQCGLCCITSKNLQEPVFLGVYLVFTLCTYLFFWQWRRANLLMVVSYTCWSKKPKIWQPQKLEAHVIPLWKGMQTSVSSSPLKFLKAFVCVFLSRLLPIIPSLRYLLPSKSKSSSKKKTPVVKKTKSPNYNHTFVYNNLSLEQLKDMCLELTVWDRETLSSNDFLGGVRLSLGAGKSI